MAWTAPRTWTTGELVTASMMNTHVRDNFNQTGPALVTTKGDTLAASAANALGRLAVGSNNSLLVADSSASLGVAWKRAAIYKASDETVNNSTALQDDDELIWPVAASEIWHFEYWLLVSNPSTTPDFKCALTVPASASGYIGVVGGDTGAAPAGMNTTLWGGTAPASTPAAIQATITATLTFGCFNGITGIALVGVFINSTNAGNVTLQWAQNTLTAVNTILKAGSHVLLTKLN